MITCETVRRKYLTCRCKVFKLGVEDRGDADEVRVEIVHLDYHKEDGLVVPYDLNADAQVTNV